MKHKKNVKKSGETNFVKAPIGSDAVFWLTMYQFAFVESLMNLDSSISITVPIPPNLFFDCSLNAHSWHISEIIVKIHYTVLRFGVCLYHNLLMCAGGMGCPIIHNFENISDRKMRMIEES